MDKKPPLSEIVTILDDHRAIIHYGVKGMSWGKRKALKKLLDEKKKSGEAVTYTTESGAKITTYISSPTELHKKEEDDKKQTSKASRLKKVKKSAIFIQKGKMLVQKFLAKIKN